MKGCLAFSSQVDILFAAVIRCEAVTNSVGMLLARDGDSRSVRDVLVPVRAHYVKISKSNYANKKR